MYFETLRNLIFLIFPEPMLVEDATKWSRESDDSPVQPPIFPQENPDFIPFWNAGETYAVKAIYEALRELSVESRQKKLEALRQAAESPSISTTLKKSLTISANDYTYWARKSIWNPGEAALISLGFRPSDRVTKAFELLSLEGFSTCHILREYGERVELIVAANQSGQLGANGDPVDLVAWFERMEYELPERLSETVNRIQSNNPAEPLTRATQYSEREKETLLKLIAAMAIRGYCFNPALSRNPATKDIQNDLELLGVGLDQKTILKWLRESTSLILPENFDYD